MAAMVGLMGPGFAVLARFDLAFLLRLPALRLIGIRLRREGVWIAAHRGYARTAFRQAVLARVDCLGITCAGELRTINAITRPWASTAPHRHRLWRVIRPVAALSGGAISASNQRSSQGS